MNEITDLQLIDHFLQRDPSDQHSRIDVQLAESPELKRRYDEVASMWQLLGAAERELPPRDLWSNINEALPIASRDGLFVSVTHAPWWVRAAATVLLAVCIGYGTGQLQLGRVKPAPVDMADAEVAGQLYLAAFDASSIQQFGSQLLNSETATE